LKWKHGGFGPEALDETGGPAAGRKNRCGKLRRGGWSGAAPRFPLHQHVDANVQLELQALLRQAFALRRDAALEPPEVLWDLDTE
jgi:hypothetical protein